jgi:hypothetical protein
MKCHFFGFVLREFLCEIFELGFLPFAISILLKVCASVLLLKVH